MWRVITQFRDLQDGNRLYRVGDEFPRPGLPVTEERLKALSGTANRRRVQIIEEVPQKAEKAPSRAKEGQRRKRRRLDADGDLPGAEKLVRP